MGIRPFWVFAHHLVGIAIAVTLLIGFVHYVDAPTVAEFVKVFTIGIVAGAQEVDVRLLHQRDVLFVGGIIHITPRHRMVIVAVHTSQFDVLAIYLEDLTHTLHTFYTEMVVKMLNNVAFLR